MAVQCKLYLMSVCFVQSKEVPECKMINAYVYVLYSLLQRVFSLQLRGEVKMLAVGRRPAEVCCVLTNMVCLANPAAASS